MKKNLVLIGGCMRSGTTLLASILGNLSNSILVSDELSWYWNHIYTPYQFNTFESLKFALHKEKPLLKRILKKNPKVNIDKLISEIDASLNKYTDDSFGILCFIIENITGKEILENTFIKVTHSGSSYKKFLTDFKQAKVVHITRSKNKVIESQLQKGRNIKSYRVTKNIFIKYFKKIRDLLNYYVISCTSSNKAIALSKLGRQFWVDMEIFSKAYDYENKCFEQLSQKFRDRIFNAHFESLTNNRKESQIHLKKIYHFIFPNDNNYSQFNYKNLVSKTSNNSSYGAIENKLIIRSNH